MLFNTAVYNEIQSRVELDSKCKLKSPSLNADRLLILTHTCEPRHEKTCLCHVRITKAQISLRIRAV